MVGKEHWLEAEGVLLMNFADLMAHRETVNAALAEGYIFPEVEAPATEPEEAAEAPVLSFAALVEAQDARSQALDEGDNAPIAQTTETPEANVEQGPDDTPGMSDKVIDRVLDNYVADSRSAPHRQEPDIDNSQDDESSNDGGARGPHIAKRKDAATLFNEAIFFGSRDRDSSPRSIHDVAMRRRDRPIQIGKQPTK